METQTLRTDLWTWLEAGEEERLGGMEGAIWKHTLPYVKHIANRNLLYDSENSHCGSVTT